MGQLMIGWLLVIAGCVAISSFAHEALNCLTVDVKTNADAGTGVCSLQAEPTTFNNNMATTSIAFRTRQIALKFITTEQREGVGARVRRSVGTIKLRNLDPFLMLDEFNVGLPGGFPDHPHRGFETVTYVLPTSKGHMLHEDFLGNKGELRPGDLQWMTPGRGILHAEMPMTEEPSHGLQLWINLPKVRKIMEPRYQEVKREQVPHVFDSDAQQIEAIVFAGEVFGTKGPITTEAPVTYVHFILKKDATLEYKIPQGHNAFIYTLHGHGICAGAPITAHEAIVLEKEGDGIHVTTTNENGVEFIVISGQPLNEPVVQHGPFVMTTEEEIYQTMYDYQLGTNGFENAPNWESDLSRRRYSH